MVAVAANYITRWSRVLPTSGKWSLVLAADIRRFYLEFRDAGTNSSGPGPVPGPPPTFLGSAAVVVYPYQVKFVDAPGWTVGEWYGFVQPGGGYTIIEQLYVGP